MSSAHVVVVWEWQRGSVWLPHGAGVARALERAHHKRLTRLALADADPDPKLRHTAVNLRTLTQTDHEGEGGEGGGRLWRVRRAVYSVQSPAARGVAWSWAGGAGGAGDQEEPLPMELQCRLEHAWRNGGQVEWDGWRARLGGQAGVLLARHGSGACRSLRRAPAPPYPLARAPPPTPPPRNPPHHLHAAATLPCGDREQRALPPSAPAPAAHAISHATNRAISHATAPASPRDRKPGLARQILHNLNIFRDTRGPPSDSDEAYEAHGAYGAYGAHGAHGAAEAHAHAHSQPDDARARRHSVDTVSTYLSHESKDGEQRASVSSLLNCSGGSDDVFEQPAPAAPAAPRGGAGGAGGAGAGAGGGVVGGAEGAQPAGSMSWRVQEGALPHCGSQRTILVSYSFQSGVQGEADPAPGAPYYAVGFPRHSLLPDCALGHAVLSALRACWSRRALFTVRASHTTGREYVVAWRVPPPPGSAAPYARHPPERLLRAALQRLLPLLPAAPPPPPRAAPCCSGAAPSCAARLARCPLADRVRTC